MKTLFLKTIQPNLKTKNSNYKLKIIDIKMKKIKLNINKMNWPVDYRSFKLHKLHFLSNKKILKLN